MSKRGHVDAIVLVEYNIRNKRRCEYCIVKPRLCLCTDKVQTMWN